MSNIIQRRQFLTGAIATPFILESYSRAQERTQPRQGQGPNGRINLGFIGVGMMGRGHLGGFLGNRDVQVVAVCDVHRQRREDAVERVHRAYAAERKSGAYRGCTAFVDFRQLLERRDIDAVVIATPDHWHHVPAVLAARARKDIYCEKPLSLTIAEGRAMVTAARDNNIVFQTGSQQRTEYNGNFRKAVEYVRSGKIGQVRTIRIGVGPARPCNLPNEMTPDGTDWEMWNGPSPARAFNQILCPLNIHNHFPAWRDFREYAGGGLSDMGAHHFDIAQWALNMDTSAPTEIHPPGTGDTGLRFVYANGVEMIHGGNIDCRFEGTENRVIEAGRGYFRSTPAEIARTPLGERDFHLPNIGNSHHRNWIDCIRSRNRPVADVEIGARTAQVCQLANIGYQLRRRLTWDPAREEFRDDVAANRLRSRENRAPWNRV